MHRGILKLIPCGCLLRLEIWRFNIFEIIKESKISHRIYFEQSGYLVTLVLSNFSFMQLLLAAAVCDRSLTLSSTFNKLPSLSSILKLSGKSESKVILENIAKKTMGDITSDIDQMDTDVGQDSKGGVEDNFLFTKESPEVQEIRFILHSQMLLLGICVAQYSFFSIS